MQSTASAALVVLLAALLATFVCAQNLTAPPPVTEPPTTIGPDESGNMTTKASGAYEGLLLSSAIATAFSFIITL